jgi:transcriptional regulator with XRE-family HTH domain
MSGLGLTNDSLARQVGVCLDTIAKWRSNNARPVGPKVQRLAAVLGVSEVDLRKRMGDAHALQQSESAVA